MNAASSPVTDPSHGVVTVTCIYEAPRRLVFEAWTRPEHLLRWFGPNGFTTPFCKVDLRPGGSFHFCMRSPDGVDVWGRGVYREVVAGERIVYTDSFADAEGRQVAPEVYGINPDFPPETLVTVTFAERDGQTSVTLEHSFPGPVVDGDAIRQGWTEMLDRLTGHLAELRAATSSEAELASAESEGFGGAAAGGRMEAPRAAPPESRRAPSPSDGRKGD